MTTTLLNPLFQEIAVGLILLVVAFVIGRHFYRMITNRGKNSPCRSCPDYNGKKSCDHCPSKNGQG